jgi:hypothetical protein
MLNTQASPQRLPVLLSNFKEDLVIKPCDWRTVRGRFKFYLLTVRLKPSNVNPYLEPDITDGLNGTMRFSRLLMYPSDSLHPAATLQVPVAFIVFNRPGTTQRVFDAIGAARPAKLLLIADGPRENKGGEAEACRQVRDIVSHVDWPCEVFTNFAEGNLGCQERVISGLNWVFSLVEEAIILEDDCLPDPSFFPFCRELLERYRGDSRIAYISGCNLVGEYLDTEDSYFFSQIGGIWGWATWRSEWQRYDQHLEDWPELRGKKMLSEIFDQPKTAAYWTHIFDSMHEKSGPNTWDHQWLYTGLKNHSLVAVSSVNLIANIGFGEGATHTVAADSRLAPAVTAIKLPLIHPSSLIPRRSLDCRLHDLRSKPIHLRIVEKLRRVGNRTVGRRTL